MIATLVQVMTWYWQATSHYMSLCLPRSGSSYGATRPQWVKSLNPVEAYLPQWTGSSLVEAMSYRLLLPAIGGSYADVLPIRPLTINLDGIWMKLLKIFMNNWKKFGCKIWIFYACLNVITKVFSWIKMLEIRLIFQWSLFLWVESTILHHWFKLWLGTDQATSHYLNQWWLVNWRIYASLGLSELRYGKGVIYIGIFKNYATHLNTLAPEAGI